MVGGTALASCVVRMRSGECVAVACGCREADAGTETKRVAVNGDRRAFGSLLRQTVYTYLYVRFSFISLVKLTADKGQIRIRGMSCVARSLGYVPQRTK